ncbi:MAG: hypothetical protein ACOY4K_15865 [Pseudomonadota bacterium]
MKTLTSLLTAAGAAAALALSAAPSTASPDQAARVDAQIRPNFGGLITPPVKPRWRPDRWRPRDGGYGRGYDNGGYGNGYYNGGYGQPYPPGDRTDLSISVDCGLPSESGQPVSDALQYLADGGTLYIRGTCRETIWIEHPVTIVGEESSYFADAPSQRATIAPPEGAACVKVAPGVDNVEIRGLILSTEKAGRAACVEAWDSRVALVRTSVRYWGDTAAVFASGGMLVLYESFVDARTWDAAVVADGAVLRMTRTRVLGEEAGVDVTPGVGDSIIEQSGILGRDAALPAGNGILVRGQRSGSGALKVNNAVVCGWRNGLHLDRGSIVEVNRSRFCRNDVGVVTDGDLTLLQSVIGAREVGLYAATGKATIKGNRFYGWTMRPIWIEQGVVFDFEPNYAYFADDCWKRSWEQGIYCQRNAGLNAGIRDESAFSSPYRDWWEADGYERGYARDGAPQALPPPQPPAPPKKKGWGRRN